MANGGRKRLSDQLCSKHPCVSTLPLDLRATPLVREQPIKRIHYKGMSGVCHGDGGNAIKLSVVGYLLSGGPAAGGPFATVRLNVPKK